MCRNRVRLGKRAVEVCPNNTEDIFEELGDILTKHFFLSIQAGFVSMATLENRWDLPQWVETISIASFLSVCFFLSHFLKDLWRKRKIWERSSGQSQDNSIFAFTLLATEEDFQRNSADTRDSQRHHEQNYIWILPYSVNMQCAWLIVKTIKSLEARWLQSVMSGGEMAKRSRGSSVSDWYFEYY